MQSLILRFVLFKTTTKQSCGYNLGHHKEVNKLIFTAHFHFEQFLLQGGHHHGGGGEGEDSAAQCLPRARVLSLLCQSWSRHDPKC